MGAMSAPVWPVLPDGRYAVLRTHHTNGASRGGFRWPTEVGGVAVAPDWDPDPAVECGHGLHGLLWGCGDGSLLTPSLTWAIVAVDPGDIATRLDDTAVPPKVRFRAAEVIHIGDRDSATGWIAAHGGAGLPVVYGTATAGNRGTATAGNGGTATAGDDGTATAGNRGTATAGNRGTATAGDGGVLVIRYHDRSGSGRLSVGQVDGVTLLPDTPYRLDAAGEFEVVV